MTLLAKVKIRYEFWDSSDIVLSESYISSYLSWATMCRGSMRSIMISKPHCFLPFCYYKHQKHNKTQQNKTKILFVLFCFSSHLVTRYLNAGRQWYNGFKQWFTLYNWGLGLHFLWSYFSSKLKLDLLILQCRYFAGVRLNYKICWFWWINWMIKSSFGCRTVQVILKSHYIWKSEQDTITKRQLDKISFETTRLQVGFSKWILTCAFYYKPLLFCFIS